MNEGAPVPAQRTAGDDKKDWTPGLMAASMIAQLREHGLNVRIVSRPGERRVILRATQPAIPTEVVEAPVFSTPGLSQEVALLRDPDSEGYAWFWVWGDGFRNAGNAEYERLAKGTDVEIAADNIRKVLRVNNFL